MDEREKIKLQDFMRQKQLDEVVGLDDEARRFDELAIKAFQEKFRGEMVKVGDNWYRLIALVYRKSLLMAVVSKSKDHAVSKVVPAVAIEQFRVIARIDKGKRG